MKILRIALFQLLKYASISAILNFALHQNFLFGRCFAVPAVKFFRMRSYEFAERLTPFKNECKADGKRLRAEP